MTATRTEPAPTLVRGPGPAPAVGPPALDAEQRRVVEHRGGPLLVLAGPGTGKTTTLVEAMVARLGGPAPLRPEQVLGLTFGRKAAQEWRERVTARLGGGLVPTVTTFHSFSYALVRQHADPQAYTAPPRLLSGPEQELRLRELLEGSVRDGRLEWPERLRAALGTRGLATEVRAVVARARALGLDPVDLQRIGAGAGELGPGWSAVGRFLEEYLDVLDAEGTSDYTEVVHRAGLLAHDGAVQAQLRASYPVVLVDELQDTDPAQLRLLRGLAGPGTTLIAVGDPDQSIYAFRGADVGGILGFPEQFRGPDGSSAPVIVLRHTRRFGPVLRAAAGRVLRTSSLAPMPAEVVRRHRHPVCAPGPDGELEVLTFDSESAEATHIADTLRRAHLEAELAWEQMAVVVRSGRISLPRLRRALTAAGVPVEVAADELPLSAEPALTPLLTLLTVAVQPPELDDPTLEALLLSPLAGADPGDLRRLGRTLRRLERIADPDGRPTPSVILLRRFFEDLVADPQTPDPLAADARSRDARVVPALRAVRRLAMLLHSARAQIDAGEGVAQVLWAVWSGTSRRGGGTGWAQRLEQTALRGGEAGRRADADLDAVLALFAAAERVEDRYAGTRGVTNFLAELSGQVIPSDTLAERGLRGPAVRLLTAHRAKGLQWSLVVVAGVQDGLWPDLHRRGSLLAPDRLGPGGLADPAPMSELLAEERRLFYVACTRARHRLIVTAVRSALDDGPQPSRFVADIAGEAPVRHVVRRGDRVELSGRTLSVAGLVADLRAVAVDPAAAAALREAAVDRLAVLAGAVDDHGRALVPTADPDHWWGTAELTSAPVPVRPAGEPLAFSGTQLKAIATCPLQWFLQHEAEASMPRTAALGFGSVVHVLADAIARGELAPDLDAVGEHVDRVWGELGFRADWESRAERSAATAAMGRFLRWHAGRPTRTLLASEAAFEVTVPIGAHGVRLRGSFDRVEAEDGQVHVVDLKTQKSPESRAALADHPQLGAYQLAIRHGALADLPASELAAAGLSAEDGAAPPVAGAELVLLRLATKDGCPKVQSQPSLDPIGPTWVEDALLAADQIVRSEQFVATPGEHCGRCALRRACPASDEGVEVIG